MTVLTALRPKAIDRSFAEPSDKGSPLAFAIPPADPDPAVERLYRKQRLAGALRIFARQGFDFGMAGHFVARDPEWTDHFWVNAWGKPFSLTRVSDLVLVGPDGGVVGSDRTYNRAAYAIHYPILRKRPEIVSSVHVHSVYGKTWSAVGREIQPLTQDLTAFYEDHVVFDAYEGLMGRGEGEAIAETLGPHKAAVLLNHGLLTVGTSVEVAAWWFIAFEDACRVQLLAEGAGTPKPLPHEMARKLGSTKLGIGNDTFAWASFHNLWQEIVQREPDFLE